MNDTGPISKKPPELKSQDFSFLREEGLELIRSIASETWTDHNLHDPGITLLEAICYAVTEIGLRSGMEIRDLIASDTSEYKQSLRTAAEILPAAALTLTDFRKILIDHPLVRNAWLFDLSSEPAGNYSVLLEFEEEELNSNTFSITVNPVSLAKEFKVDVAFPYWDEEDVFPFYEEVTLLNVSFEGIPGNEWNPISGSEAYFARILVDYQPSVGGPESTRLWLVARVTTPMDDPLGDLPVILDEIIAEIVSLGPGSWLETYKTRVSTAYNTIRIIRRYLKDYRNLCEEFISYKAVRLQEIAVSATIDVNPGVVLEDLLADIFLTIDRFIAPEIIFKSLGDFPETQSSNDIFDGPLLESGFLPETSLGDPELTDVFYTSDILRLILQLRNQNGQDVLQREDLTARNIVAVRNLSLTNYLDNRPIASNARDCLHLVESQRHIPRLSLSKSRIVFFRNGIEVPYDLNQVIQIVDDKKNEISSQQVTHSTDIPLPDGEDYEIDEYYPVQNDLPLVYGVGEAGLPENTTEARKALALQLKGYLLFYEQLIAGMASQLSHLNAFFSSDPSVDRTLFQQPLYHLPQIRDILKSYTSYSGTWEDYINDPDNEYVTTLWLASESREQFLNRRNKVLDHLLSVFGEDLKDKASLLFRKASLVPDAGILTLEQLMEIQSQQRNRAASQLISEKAAFLEDIPALNRDRAQSYGNPVRRSSRLFHAGDSVDGIWFISDSLSNPVFRASSGSTSMKKSLRNAAEALSLATTERNYAVKAEPGGQHRLEILPGSGSSPVAETEATYGSNALALAAIPGWVHTTIRLWWSFGLSPVECRLYHMLGIHVKERRQLIHPLAEFFEIYDDTPDPNFEKRFRLWELPGFAGNELLNSETNYAGTSDALAIENAENAIGILISRGLFPENYNIENPGPGVFQVVLTLLDGSIIARSANLTTADQAELEIERICKHLYFWYSAEGFYMIEHSRLFPTAETDPELIIGESEDPYSFQMTFIFPSGYARDFTGSLQVPLHPDTNRDLEFRQHAENQVRKTCPSHILPRILWVDRTLPGSITTPADPSFDNFELRYRSWFEAWIVDEMEESVINPIKNDLVEIINRIYMDLIP